MTRALTRVALTSTYTTTAGVDTARDAVLRYLLRTGLRLADDEPGVITADGGSQLVVRMLGVWFAAPDAYPRRVRVTFTPTAGGTQVHADIEESLGFGYLDRHSRRNYLAAFQAWLDGLNIALERASTTAA